MLRKRGRGLWVSPTNPQIITFAQFKVNSLVSSQGLQFLYDKGLETREELAPGSIRREWAVQKERVMCVFLRRGAQDCLMFCCYCSVTKLCLTLCDPHGLQHARLPCPSLSLIVCSNPCSLSLWCYLTISSSAAPFSFCLQSFPVSGSFPVNRIFTSGGQSIAASASVSVLPVNIQDWFPLGLTGLMSRSDKYL